MHNCKAGPKEQLNHHSLHTKTNRYIFQYLGNYIKNLEKKNSKTSFFQNQLGTMKV